ncbi:MAG: LamG domain-containing protein [Phycisphaerae bacterium]|nr:LamG domain-containing protein [Phycisphaerae bacterium]
MADYNTGTGRPILLLLLAPACLLAGVSSAAADLNDGLVGYWSFDEGEGGTAYDYSGHGNHGTIYGATWTTGISVSALGFDGENDYVHCGSTLTGGVLPAFSVSAWIHVDQSPGGHVFYDGSDGEFSLSVSASQRASFSVKLSNGTWYGTSSRPILLSGAWYQVAGIYDRTEGRLEVFVNGVLENVRSIPSLAPYDPGGDYFPTIGAYCNSAGNRTGFFHGVIDEVRTYNRALSEDGILDLYWSTAHPDPQEETTEGDQSEVSGISNDPVNTATGSFFHQETDLSIPSRGSPLVFTRFYNSKAAAPGRRAAKSKQAPQKRKSTTSQPANVKDGERSSVDAKKHNESPAGKDQEQVAGSSQARAEAKEKSK